MFYFLFHVIYVNRFIFAPSDHKATVGCHRRQGGSVGMVSEVSHRSPGLRENETDGQHRSHNSSLKIQVYNLQNQPMYPANGEKLGTDTQIKAKRLET